MAWGLSLIDERIREEGVSWWDLVVSSYVWVARVRNRYLHMTRLGGVEGRAGKGGWGWISKAGWTESWRRQERGRCCLVWVRRLLLLTLTELSFRHSWGEK